MADPTLKTGAPITPLARLLAATNPNFMDKHAQWLASGGDRVLQLVPKLYRGDLWPWRLDPHQQSSFGAFVAGVQCACEFMAELQLLVNDKTAMASQLSAVNGNSNVMVDNVRDILKREFGFSEAEIEAHFNKAKSQ